MGEQSGSANHGHLDRILASTSFEQQYPLISVRAASRAGSDHTLLVIDFCLEVDHKLPPFRFEKWWLEREEFQNLVAKTWNTHFHYAIPLDRWQAKVGLLRRKIKGWSKNVNGKIRKYKK